jgi:hypothetical protein
MSFGARLSCLFSSLAGSRARSNYSILCLQGAAGQPLGRHCLVLCLCHKLFGSENTGGAYKHQVVKGLEASDDEPAPVFRKCVAEGTRVGAGTIARHLERAPVDASG